MGLLDDAIREHLELKRLRGADPDEVARLEREALGPPHRRAEAHVETPAHAEDEDGAPSARHEEAVVPAFYDDELDDEARHSLPATAQDTEEHDMEAELYAEPATLVPAADAQEVEHEQGAAEGASGEEEEEVDVLEETPDFLQQAPEHDRLWFEQQPPRDFDFDK